MENIKGSNLNFVQNTLDDIQKLVNEIHEKFGHGSLFYRYQSINYE